MMETVPQVQVNTVKREGFLFFIMCLNCLTTVMNTTMFSVAIPSIQKQFGLDAVLTSWIVTGYSIVFALGSVMYGKLSDRYSIRRLMTWALILLGIGSLLGLLAPNFNLLLLARLIQSTGASGVAGLVVIFVSRFIPMERRGAANGKHTAAAALGFGLGPVIGGFVNQYLGWAFLFGITLLSVCTFTVYRRYLPLETEKNLAKEKDKLDYVGLILLCSGTVLSLLFFSFHHAVYAIGFVLLLLFWWHIHHKENPFIYPHLLHIRPFLFCIFIGFLNLFLYLSVMFVIPLLLSSAYRVNSDTIGLVIFPGAILSSVVTLYIGRMLDRLGTFKILGVGIFFWLIATFLFSSFGNRSMVLILAIFVIAGFGYSSINTAVLNQISKVVAKQELGSGLGILSLMQYFGGAFGVAVMGLMLDAKSLQHPLNVLWTGTAGVYSNIFLLLLALAVLSACLLVLLVREREKGNA